MKINENNKNYGENNINWGKNPCCCRWKFIVSFIFIRSDVSDSQALQIISNCVPTGKWIFFAYFFYFRYVLGNILHTFCNIEICVHFEQLIRIPKLFHLRNNSMALIRKSENIFIFIFHQFHILTPQVGPITFLRTQFAH